MASEREDYAIRVTADVEEASRNFDQLHQHIAALSVQGVDRLRALDHAFSGLRAGISAVVGRIHPLAAAGVAVVNSLQQVHRQAEQLLETAVGTASAIGEQLDEKKFEDKFKALKLGLAELRAGFAAMLTGVVNENTPAARWLDALVERTTAAARYLTSVSELLLPAEERSNTALAARIEWLEGNLRALANLEVGSRRGDIVARLYGTPEEIQAQWFRVQAEIERLRGTLANREEPFGHLNLPEIDQQIAALKKHNLELRIQAETHDMAAHAAARHRAEQLALAAAGERWDRMSQQQRANWRWQVEESERLTGWRRWQEDEKKADRLLGSAEIEVARLDAQARALSMTAGEAARLSFIEREMVKFRQAGIAPTSDMIVRILEMGEAFEKATERLKRLQREMAHVQDLGHTVSSSLERAFSDWLSGAEQSWKKFFNTLARDMALLVLRHNILQPLFGGGGVQGAGLFGQMLSGVGGMFTGAGAGLGGWQTAVTPAGGAGADPWQTTVIPAGGAGAGISPWQTTVNTSVELLARMLMFANPFGGARAAGGPVSAGTAYMVGEHGPEPFIPNVDGMVLPNSALGRNTTINMRIDLAGANGDETIARIAGGAARAAYAAAVRDANEMLPSSQHRWRMMEG